MGAGLPDMILVYITSGKRPCLLTCVQRHQVVPRTFHAVVTAALVAACGGHGGSLFPVSKCVSPLGKEGTLKPGGSVPTLAHILVAFSSRMCQHEGARKYRISEQALMA